MEPSNFFSTGAPGGSEEFFKLLVGAIWDAVLVTDLDGKLVFANRRAEEISGYRVEDFAGRALWELMVPETASSVRDRFRSTDRGESVSPTFTGQIVRKDGRHAWVEISSSTIEVQGRPAGRLAVVRDVTERRRVEDTLRLQSAALEAAANGIVITDRDGVIVWTNAAFTRLTGYEAAEALGSTPRILKSSHHDAAFYKDLWARLRAGETWRGEMVNRRKDGSVYHEEQTITPVRGRDGGVTHFIAIKQDVTEQRRGEDTERALQARLARSEKLAALGELLAGVAHELNNPLAVIIGHAEMLRLAAGPGGERGQKIAAAAERCARIIRNFLTLARQRPPERRSVDLNDLARDTLEMLAYMIHVEDVSVEQDLDATLPALAADGSQIQRVLVNLVTNAVHAMQQAAPPRRLTVMTRYRAETRSVRLEVHDTGPGIAPEVEARLFEPFFTTKPVGQGTGLGLSISKGIVEAHGGRMHVEPRPGVGARFAVELPLGRADELENAPVASAAPIARTRVLVVDDEEAVAEVIVEMLSQDGHDATAAVTSADAVARLREQPYDAILCDIKMPGVDGREFYHELRHDRPDLAAHVGFITGDTLSPTTRRFLEEARRPCLEKPFTPDELRAVLHQIVGSGTTGG